jgi:chromosome partitioning protein
VLINKRDIQDVILKTDFERLEIAPASIRLDRAEQQLVGEVFRESRLHKAIKNLDYDYIVVDCRPTLGTLTVNAMYASNFIVVPCLTSRFSLEGFADLLDTFNTVKNGEDMEGGHIIRILINNLDSRKKIMREWVWNELEPYKDIMFETIIRQDETLNLSQAAGRPAFYFRPKSHAAEDFKSLTTEFLNLCRQLETS